MSYENERYEDFREDPALIKAEKEFKACHGNWYVNVRLPLLRNKTFEDDKGKTREKFLKTDIPRAIWVEAIVSNILSNCEYIELGFLSDTNEQRKVKVKRSILSGTASSPEAKKLTEMGAPIGTCNFKTFVDFLMDHDIRVKGIKHKRGVDLFGWYGEGLNFIFTQSIGEDPELIQLQSDTSLKAFKPRGDYSVWLKMFKEAVIDHLDGDALFACSYAMSSLLKGVLSRDFEFIPALLIYGESGTGKSTIQQLIASMVGRAGLLSKNEGVILTFNSTLNALQVRMASLGPIPCIVDEKSLEKETQGRKMVLDDILYTINTGIKDRLNASSDPSEEYRPVECSLTLSGEAAEDLSGNTGKQYRLVQQRWTGFKGETNGSLAESIKNTVARHSGYFLPVYISYLIDKKSELEKTYQDCEKVAVKILKLAQVPKASISRMTPNLARARLSCIIILSAMMTDPDETVKCIQAFDETAIEVYSNNIIKSEFERIPEKLAEGLAVNSNKFSTVRTNSGSARSKYSIPPGGEIWGRIFDTGTVGVYGRYLTALVNDEFSSSQVREAIIKLGGKKRGIKVAGVTSYMWCFKLPDYLRAMTNKEQSKDGEIHESQ